MTPEVFIGSGTIAVVFFAIGYGLAVLQEWLDKRS